MDTNQIDPDTYQFPPVSVYLAKSDAAWLRLWAPDPRALGAEAMGLAALRGLLAEDQPKDGQPLGGEIQHARALIENARAERMIGETAGEYVARRADEIRASDLDGSEMFAKPRHDAASRIAALEESREASISVAGDHSRKLIGLLERIKEVEAEHVNAASDIGKFKDRINNFGKDRARDVFRLDTAFTYMKRIAALEAKS